MDPVGRMVSLRIIMNKDVNLKDDSVQRNLDVLVHWSRDVSMQYSNWGWDCIWDIKYTLLVSDLRKDMLVLQECNNVSPD